MSNQTEPTYTSAGGSIQRAGAGQPPRNGSSKKIIIGAVIAALVLCCVCGSTAGLGTAAYFLFQKSSEIQTNNESAPELIEPTLAEEILSTPEIVYSTEEARPTPDIITSQTDTAVPETQPNDQGLGVSRDDMIQFFNSGDAFNFGKPTKMQGIEIVLGEHKSLCIQKNCAAVTLAGPADDLIAVSVVAPTDPGSMSQTATSIALLMDAVAQFAGDNSELAVQMMGDLTQAQAVGNSFEKTIQENGYSFTENYDAKTHNLGIAITRPK
jgi:hypothetical protein